MRKPKPEIFESIDALKAIDTDAGIMTNAEYPVVVYLRGTAQDFLFALTVDKAIALYQRLDVAIQMAVGQFGIPANLQQKQDND